MPSARATTAFPTSSGVPHRDCSSRPLEISVMSVKLRWSAGTRPDLDCELEASDDLVLEAMIRPLLNLAINAHALLLAEIKRFKNVRQDKWPLPKGYRTRMVSKLL